MTADAPGTPPAEVEITEALIAQLVAQQFPDLAHLPIRIVGEGATRARAAIATAGARAIAYWRAGLRISVHVECVALVAG